MSDPRNGEADSLPEPEDRERWRVALVILSPLRSAAQLGDAVGLAPDRAFNRGERHTHGQLRPKFSGVEYWSPVLSKPALIHDRLPALLARLEPYQGRIAALAVELATEPGDHTPIRLWFVAWPGRGESGYDLPPDQLAAIAALGAHFGISVECWDEEESSDPPKVLRE